MNRRRRKFVALASAGLLVPRLLAAQQSATVYRVGYLSISSHTISKKIYYETFKKRMHELGYIEGRNIVFEPRWAETNVAHLPGLAAELVALKSDVIVAVTNPSVAAVKQVTATIPIVMVVVAGPVKSGFISSLAHPGANITGVTTLGEDLVGKTVELIHASAPKARRIAVLISGDPSHVLQLNQLQDIAKRIGLAVVSARATSPEEIDTAFASFIKEKAEALIVLADALFMFAYSKIIELTGQAKLPAIFQARELTDAGGLMSYGPNVHQNFRLAADYVDKILHGAKPGDLPVQQPTKFELVINMKTAKALGLTIPQTVLLLADEVIE